jgi:hypothetical protein
MTIDLHHRLTPEFQRELCRTLWGSRDLAAAFTALGPANSGQHGAHQPMEVTSAQGRSRVFIKVLAPTLREAASYRVLTRAQAPLARLLAAGDHAGDEVVVLEHLACIGIGELTQHAFGEFIDTLARFHACQAQELPVTPATWMSTWLESLQQAWHCARGGDWGSGMAHHAAVLDGAWPAVRGLALELAERINQLPWVTMHHDPAYSNIGRRSADAPLVFFDLHYGSRFPWGRDLALALVGFVQPWPDQAGREPWIECYCDTFQRQAVITLDCDVHLAVAQQLAAYRCWFDAPTLRSAQAAHQRDAEGFQHRDGTWLAGWSGDTCPSGSLLPALYMT